MVGPERAFHGCILWEELCTRSDGTMPHPIPTKKVQFSQEEMGCAGFWKVGAGRALEISQSQGSRLLFLDKENGGPERVSNPRAHLSMDQRKPGLRFTRPGS